MPLDLVHGCGAGDQIHLEHLAAYLAGRLPRDTPERDIEARWEELMPAYQALAANID